MGGLERDKRRKELSFCFDLFFPWRPGLFSLSKCNVSSICGEYTKASNALANVNRIQAEGLVELLLLIKRTSEERMRWDSITSQSVPPVWSKNERKLCSYAVMGKRTCLSAF